MSICFFHVPTPLTLTCNFSSNIHLDMHSAIMLNFLFHIENSIITNDLELHKQHNHLFMEFTLFCHSINHVYTCMHSAIFFNLFISHSTLHVINT
jgi:hypothetical protein